MTDINKYKYGNMLKYIVNEPYSIVSPYPKHSYVNGRKSDMTETETLLVRYQPDVGSISYVYEKA